MQLPTTKIETEILMKDKESVILGVDEAGRGPLAGPVVAAAVWVNPEFLDQGFELRKFVRDSKTVPTKRREEIFEFVFANNNFAVGIGEVSNQVIDKSNILKASLLAMRIAIENVEADPLIRRTVVDSFIRRAKDNTHCLIDGKFNIPKINHSQRLFVGGDRDIFSIALASICAKVVRDRIMHKLNQEFPLYGFDRHKGYGTKLHLQSLAQHGPCPVHRFSFKPIKKCLQKK